MKKFFADFKAFITRGNVIDMAVGVVVGGAFSKIVTGFVNYIINPFVGIFLKSGSLDSIKTVITPEELDPATGEGIDDYDHFSDFEDAKMEEKDIVNEETGELIVPANTMITEESAKEIIDAGIEQVEVRTILRCLAKRGVCVHCYGADLASGKSVNVGEAVGIIAAPVRQETYNEIPVAVTAAGRDFAEPENILNSRFLNMLNHNYVYGDGIGSVEAIVNNSIIALLDLRDKENEDYIG